MLLITHLWTTLALAKIMQLGETDSLIALGAGVGIDLDHLIKPVFQKELRFKIISTLKKRLPLGELQRFSGVGPMHTFIHEPIGLVIVAIFSWIFHSRVLFIFYLLHFVLDHIAMKSQKQPFYPFDKKIYMYGLVPLGTLVEWTISSSILIVVLFLL